MTARNCQSWPGSRRAPALLASALLLFSLLLAGTARGQEVEALPAALLTRDLGDPRAPGNVKLVLTLPPSLADRTPWVEAGDFRVYVYPSRLGMNEGLDERYEAGALYLWQNRDKIFIDSRLVPLQDEEGPATVVVEYAPENAVLARGVAEGMTRYAGELADVILAVDISRSMLYNDRNKLRVTAARTFIDMARMGGGVGRVGLVTFNHAARLVTPLKPLHQGEELLAALSRIGADGLTSLDAPLQLSLREFSENGPSSRPVVILLTDGKNEGTRYKETHRRCAEAGVRLFTVGLSESADHALLQEMAEATGGIYFRAPRDSDLPEIYARLAAELGKRQLLSAELLDSVDGALELPIDGTVRRFVVMADAGARVDATGPTGAVAVGAGLGSLFMVNPAAGMWRFGWTDASPDLSVLALFGETSFFLDVFPPQLRGDRLAVGATLAHGANALADADVWLEPLSGIIGDPVRLYDDGLHGDGIAGDGVYGALVDVLPGTPDRFDIILRADGAAWDKGDFVRQALGLVIRSDEPEPPELEPEPEPEPELPPEPMPPEPEPLPEPSVVPEPEPEPTPEPPVIVAPEPEPVPPEPEPEPETARLDGDIDFGILFPGETGAALAKVDLDARQPRLLSFDLSWTRAGDSWPDLSSMVRVEPGKRAFELQMQVPVDASPGLYDGEFAIDDGDGLSDRVPARVRVGTVRFGDVPPVDLGVVPPGTFASRRLVIAHAADKAADLDIETAGDADLSASSDGRRLAAGEGDTAIEVMVSVPTGKRLGDYAGLVRLRAGPGILEIPVSWTVKTYSLAPARSAPPPSGLPPAPALPGDRPATPLERLAGTMDPSSLHARDHLARGPDHGPDPLGSGNGEMLSPWNRSAGILPDGPDVRALDHAQTRGPAAPATAFPAIEVPKKAGGDSFWSAWWVYLLAALLLLLLLLLLLAYILYRLGKSRLAWLLLISALANLILLAIFLALLSTVSTVAPQAPPTMTVSLVEEEYQPAPGLTEAERALLADSSSSSSSGTSRAGDEAAIGEVAFSSAAAAAAAGESELERQTQLPDDSMSSRLLTEAARTSAEPLERRESGPMSRRSRRAEKTITTQPVTDLSEMLEMAEPPREAVSREVGLPEGETPDRGEARLELMANVDSELPVWSDGERLAQPPTSSEGLLLAEAGMEAVSLDATARRIEPTGRRRNARENPAAYPEPRVEIHDPARDNAETSSAASAREAQDPGVEEVRTQPRSMGSGRLGGKPGAVVEPGAARLTSRQPEHSARGIEGSESSELALSRGGRRTSRGGASRQGAPQPSERQILSGSRGGATGAAGSPARGGAAAGVATGEQRFDAGPASGDTGDDSSLGRAMGELAMGDGMKTAASLAPSGGGSGDRADYAPTRGGGNGALSGRDRLGPRPGDGTPGGQRGAADGPPGRQGLPGGDSPGGSPGGKGTGKGTGTTGSGPGRRGPGDGPGEGRYDDMASGGDGDFGRGVGTTGLTGLGRSELGVGDGGSGLGVIPITVSESEWRRNDRRGRKRTANVAASSLEMDSLLIVVGDFARLPDSAAGNIFAALRKRVAGGMTVEERPLLSPTDGELSSTLLAVLSPEETSGWDDGSVAAVARYLQAGGHIWMDSAAPSRSDAFMRRLAREAGGEFHPLAADHQLSRDETVDALTIDGKLAAVATYRDWRKNWRYREEGDADSLRFLVRSLNYFLSGNADVGVVMDAEEVTGGRRVQPADTAMPERLAGRPTVAGRLWDDFGPATAASWRMPSWSDPGRISAISDGEGGRALKLDMDGGGKGRMAVYRTMAPPQDFSGVKRMTFDVYYEGGGDAALAMVFTLSERGGWNDFETSPRPLSPGWNSLVIDLDAGDFRSLAEGGGFNASLPDAEHLGRAGFLLYRRQASTALVLIRDIRLHGDE